MYYKGLKLSIAGNFILMLAIGMLLVNLLLISLWQQHIITLSVNNAKNQLSIISEREWIGYPEIEEKVSLYNKQMKEISAEIVIFQKNIVTPEVNAKNPIIKRILLETATNGSESVESVGRFWSLLGLTTEMVVVSKPLNYKGENGSIAIIVKISDLVKTIWDKQSVIMVYVLVNIIILTTLGFFRMRRVIIKPLEKLTQLSESFFADSNDLLLISSKSNEFGYIASGLHNMLSRIEMDKERLKNSIKSLEEANEMILANQNTLIEAEKFAAVGRLSVGLAHEIGNPLGIIQGYIELLELDDLDKQERKQYTIRAIKELGRVTTLIHQLLGLTRKKSATGSRSAISPIIHDVVEMFKYRRNSDPIQFKVECEDFVEQARCSETDLHQVLLNCVLNSIDAIEERKNAQGIIEISCTLKKREEGNIAKILLKDNGVGIKKSDMSAVFDPFFTTKEVGYGTGLGLSVSRTIIENSGGTIHLESKNFIGTHVLICLPVE